MRVPICMHSMHTWTDALCPVHRVSRRLVFDDGKQQLWRLVPGGRTLVRKPVDKSKSATSKLTAASSGGM